MGGIGKSALASRAMEILRKDGWMLTVVVGRWSLGELATAIASQLIAHTSLQNLTGPLLSPELPDEARLALLQQLLSNHRLLSVLDNFEDNLSLNGQAFLDDAVALVLAALLQSAREGRVLITCRYPIPGLGDWLADEHLGPLSPTQTRKLFYRLPALADAEPDTLSLVLCHIGGHPRMLEYLDTLLRRGQARLPAVAHRLRVNAQKLGLHPEDLTGDLDEALRETLRLGAEDILLDQLLELINTQEYDLAVLHQAAVIPCR